MSSCYGDRYIGLRDCWFPHYARTRICAIDKYGGNVSRNKTDTPRTGSAWDACLSHISCDALSSLGCVSPRRRFLFVEMHVHGSQSISLSRRTLLAFKIWASVLCRDSWFGAVLFLAGGKSENRNITPHALGRDRDLLFPRSGCLVALAIDRLLP